MSLLGQWVIWEPIKRGQGQKGLAEVAGGLFVRVGGKTIPSLGGEIANASRLFWRALANRARLKKYSRFFKKIENNWEKSKKRGREREIQIARVYFISFSFFSFLSFSFFIF